MSPGRKKWVLCVLALFLAGCVTKQPAYIPLPGGVPQAINSSSVAILSTQHEIKAEVKKSNVAMAMGGGLIPALIDVAIEGSRAKSAEDTIKPIRDALIEYDIGAALKNSLSQGLLSLPWLKVQKVEVLQANTPDVVNSLLSSGSEDVLVVISPSYILTADFSALRTEATIEIYPRSSALKKYAQQESEKEKGNSPIYRNKAAHQYRLPSVAPDEKNAAVEWSKNQGALIKEALGQGVQSISDTFLNGLSNPQSASRN